MQFVCKNIKRKNVGFLKIWDWAMQRTDMYARNMKDVLLKVCIISIWSPIAWFWWNMCDYFFSLIDQAVCTQYDPCWNEKYQGGSWWLQCHCTWAVVSCLSNQQTLHQHARKTHIVNLSVMVLSPGTGLGKQAQLDKTKFTW